MQTIYYTTTHFVRHTDNIVDLQEYRRRLALAQEGSLAPNPREGVVWDEDWEEPDDAREQEVPCLLSLEEEPVRPESRRARREHRAMMLDVCASVGVLVMTLTFTLQMLLG